jgi:hypothetical protein
MMASVYRTSKTASGVAGGGWKPAALIEYLHRKDQPMPS